MTDPFQDAERHDAPTQLARAEPDGRDGVHRAGRCARPEGRGQGRRRARDRRQPVSEHAARQGGGHPGDRGERDGLLSESGAARVSRGGGPVRLGRVRLLGDGREHRGRLGGQAVRAVLCRGGARPGRRGAGLQPAVPDLRPQPRAPRRTGRAGAALQVEHEFRPSAEDGPPVSSRPTPSRGRSS